MALLESQNLSIRMAKTEAYYNAINIFQYRKLMTTSREYQYILPAFMLGQLPEGCASPDTIETLNNTDLQRFNTILAQFLGTKSYHNFTPRTSSFDASATRYITRFEADLFEHPKGNVIRIVIHGQV
jgi:tRNA U38,U39,U40 pseudouridine synthase TruA